MISEKQMMREHNLKINCMPCTYPKERKKLPKKEPRFCITCVEVRLYRNGKCIECGTCWYHGAFVSK